MEHEDAGHRILALAGERNGFPLGDQQIEPAPTLEMSPRLLDIGFRHVEPERGQARPGLLEEIEEAPGAAADIDEAQAPLIAPGKYLVQRDERLAADRIRGAAKKHLDLDI